MLEELKEKVWKDNLDLVKHGLVIFTWGKVSAIDRKSGLVVIKHKGQRGLRCIPGYRRLLPGRQGYL